jgi:hypothetical protein
MEYRHTQQAFLPLTLWVVFVIVMGALTAREEWAAWIGVFLFATTLVMILFSRLTVTVTNESIVTSFGVGWPRHTETLENVLTVAAVRNTWIQGWGIRKISGGWMYNVQGYGGVELDLRSGKKFRIGTDEPTELEAAIAMVIPPPRP